ncbi:hypothetical protein PR048_013797 [Dryococelus australis]|uniref:Uncharacterized protein n=1 Tax=Dryococelus australis TaxID=614101 RepID=A0ABQ9HT63_9NEOP|nr:hypothetical protein PR048_013797 [Dryococelus australis]
MCETTWAENHDAILTFLDTLPCLPVVLETISDRLSSLSLWWFWLRFWTNSGLGSELQAEYTDVLEEMKLQLYKSTDTLKKISRVRKLAKEMGTQINKPAEKLNTL